MITSWELDSKYVLVEQRDWLCNFSNWNWKPNQAQNNALVHHYLRSEQSVFLMSTKDQIQEERSDWAKIEKDSSKAERKYCAIQSDGDSSKFITFSVDWAANYFLKRFRTINNLILTTFVIIAMTENHRALIARFKWAKFLECTCMFRCLP